MWVAEGVAPHGSEVYSWIVHGSVVQNYVVHSVLYSLVVLMQIAHSFVAQSDMTYAIHRVQSCSGQNPVALVQSQAVVALPEETLVVMARGSWGGEWLGRRSYRGWILWQCSGEVGREDRTWGGSHSLWPGFPPASVTNSLASRQQHGDIYLVLSMFGC